jgi:hypothetical protein
VDVGLDDAAALERPTVLELDGQAVVAHARDFQQLPRLPGGQAGQSSRIENYLGIKRCGLTWPDVALPRMSQAQRESIEAMLREVPIDAGGAPPFDVSPVSCVSRRARSRSPPDLRVGRSRGSSAW